MKLLKKQVFKTLFFAYFYFIFYSLTALSTTSDIPERPFPQHLVNDFAGIFTSQQASSLEQMLVNYNDTTSTQITIVTVLSLNGYEVADFTDRLAEKWGVGQKGKDNGVVILIKPKSSQSDYGEAHISIGYGLEDVIPDIITYRIINNEMIPHFRENDYYGGIMAGLRVIFDLVLGKYTAEDYGDDGFFTAFIIVGFIVLIVVLIIIFRKNSDNNDIDRHGMHRSSLLPFLFLGHGMGGFGGGGSSGGGFGGFGGFGGGSFGGGGASGRW